MEVLAELTGLSVDTVEKKMGVLIGNRIIYPDGTMSRLAAQFLRTRVLALFKVGNSARSQGKGLVKKNRY